MKTYFSFYLTKSSLFDGKKGNELIDRIMVKREKKLSNISSLFNHYLKYNNTNFASKQKKFY
jgi:hypothetical protein